MADDSCFVELEYFVAMELTPDASKLLKWIGHYNQQQVLKKFQTCYPPNELEIKSSANRDDSMKEESNNSTANNSEQDSSPTKINGDDTSVSDSDSTAEIAAQCVAIFETLFPPQRWSTIDNIRDFAALVATRTENESSRPNYFASPQGGSDMTTLTNFTPEYLVDWLSSYLDIADWYYTEYIVGDVTVANAKACHMGPLVCSFDKVIVSRPKWILAGTGSNDDLSSPCYVEANSHLVMELDQASGKMLQWMDYFDAEELVAKFRNCISTWQLRAQAQPTKQRMPLILGMSLSQPPDKKDDRMR